MYSALLPSQSPMLYNDFHLHPHSFQIFVLIQDSYLHVAFDQLYRQNFHTVVGAGEEVKLSVQDTGSDVRFCYFVLLRKLDSLAQQQSRL